MLGAVQVQRLEDVVRQHQTKLPVKLDRDAARSVAALDAELEELDGQSLPRICRALTRQWSAI